jgi:putative SOS response-associated peptidase YedK
MQTGRCLVPVRAFFETSRSTRFRDPVTGRERASQFRFAMPGHSVFLIAGIAQEGRFSLMTTEPNATVGAVHTRMPLVLAPGESSVWLAGDFDRLANRGGVPLTRSEAL